MDSILVLSNTPLFQLPFSNQNSVNLTRYNKNLVQLGEISYMDHMMSFVSVKDSIPSWHIRKKIGMKD